MTARSKSKTRDKLWVASGLENLDDEQLGKLVLSNWHKLNAALQHGQAVEVLRRLLVLELSKGASARPVIAERVRAALSRALAVRSRQALVDVLERMASSCVHECEDETAEQLVQTGLAACDAELVITRIKESE